MTSSRLLLLPALTGILVAAAEPASALDTLRVGLFGNTPWTGDSFIDNVEAIPPEYKVERQLTLIGSSPGNLIDLELIGHEGLDNFIEIAPTLDAETVVNPQTVEIVNDGSNGEPASIRSCGPDDLLDFINPSSQISVPGWGNMLVFRFELSNNNRKR